MLYIAPKVELGSVTFIQMKAGRQSVLSTRLLPCDSQATFK